MIEQAIEKAQINPFNLRPEDEDLTIIVKKGLRREKSKWLANFLLKRDPQYNPKKDKKLLESVDKTLNFIYDFYDKADLPTREATLDDYVVHCYASARTIRKKNLIQAALLHDYLEDFIENYINIEYRKGKIKFDNVIDKLIEQYNEIETRFGEKTAYITWRLTNKSGLLAKLLLNRIEHISKQQVKLGRGFSFQTRLFKLEDTVEEDLSDLTNSMEKYLNKRISDKKHSKHHGVYIDLYTRSQKVKSLIQKKDKDGKNIYKFDHLKLSDIRADSKDYSKSKLDFKLDIYGDIYTEEILDNKDYILIKMSDIINNVETLQLKTEKANRTLTKKIEPTLFKIKEKFEGEKTTITEHDIDHYRIFSNLILETFRRFEVLRHNVSDSKITKPSKAARECQKNAKIFFNKWKWLDYYQELTDKYQKKVVNSKNIRYETHELNRRYRSLDRLLEATQMGYHAHAILQLKTTEMLIKNYFMKYEEKYMTNDRLNMLRYLVKKYNKIAPEIINSLKRFKGQSEEKYNILYIKRRKTEHEKNLLKLYDEDIKEANSRIKQIRRSRSMIKEVPDKLFEIQNNYKQRGQHNKALI